MCSTLKQQLQPKQTKKRRFVKKIMVQIIDKKLGNDQTHPLLRQPRHASFKRQMNNRILVFNTLAQTIQKMNEIIIYQTTDNQTQIEVQFEKETIWLTQKQIAMVFGTEIPAINKHIKNIYKAGELDNEATVSKMEIVQQEGKRQVVRTIEHYNLDVILSVGYRVNSSKATQFRIWATQRLKEHLVNGYSLNQKRLDELNRTVKLIQNSISNDTNLEEAKGLLEIISQYTQSFVLLNQYDSNSIQSTKLSEVVTYEINYKEAKEAITELQKLLLSKKNPTEAGLKVFTYGI